MRALTLARILEARQGDGTYVTSLEPSMLLEPLTFMADFHQDRTLLHVLEVRRILEAAVAGLAAQYITDEELEELRGIVEEMDACETVEAFVANDLRFHRLIGERLAQPRAGLGARELLHADEPHAGVARRDAGQRHRPDQGAARRALRRAGAPSPGRRARAGHRAHRRRSRRGWRARSTSTEPDALAA